MYTLPPEKQSKAVPAPVVLKPIEVKKKSNFGYLMLAMAFAIALVVPTHPLFAADTYIPSVHSDPSSPTEAPPTETPPPPPTEEPTPEPITLQDGVYEYQSAENSASDIWIYFRVIENGTKATSAVFGIDKTDVLPAYCRPVGTVFGQTHDIKDGKLWFQDADLGSLTVYADLQCTAVSATSASCTAIYYASGAGLSYGCFSTAQIVNLR